MENIFLRQLKEAFGGTLAICNGLTPEPAEKALENGKADLDQPDMSRFYTPGSRGYTDYKPLQATA